MKTFCISHVKDVDGLGAAAIVKAATGAQVLLSNYNSLIDDLGKVPSRTDEFVLCDLGGDNSNVDELVSRLGRIASRAKVTYVDHHYLSQRTMRRLKAVGVGLVHNEKECSSVLAYATFKKKLPEGARLIALCGAVTDYMDGSPLSKKLMEQADRQFVLLEATMLAFAVANRGAEEEFPYRVVDELAAMRHPHEIAGVPEAAVRQLVEAVELGDEVRRRGKKKGRLAYMVTTQHSTGNVAKLLIGAFEVPVGVAMKEQEDGWYEVSLRGTSECRVHLGRKIDRIASRLGGNGGGHRKAAGCRIPAGNVPKLIAALAEVV